MRQRISGILGKAYGIGILIALIAGGLSFLGYLAAFLLGGDAAAAICEFIYKSAYPVLFVFSSSVALLGLVKMYVAGEKSMSPSKRRSKSAEDGKEH